METYGRTCGGLRDYFWGGSEQDESEASDSTAILFRTAKVG